MSVYDQYKAPAGEGGLFLKLKNGESAKLRFAGQPYIFYSQFSPDSPIQTRYAWSVWNQEKQEAQIFQQGVTGYKNLAALATDPEWGDPATYDIRVSREGEGTETKYHFTPSPNKTPLSSEAEEAVKKIKIDEKIKGSILLAKVVGGAEVPQPEDTTKTSDLPPTSNYDESTAPDLSEIPF